MNHNCKIVPKDFVSECLKCMQFLYGYDLPIPREHHCECGVKITVGKEKPPPS